MEHLELKGVKSWVQSIAFSLINCTNRQLFHLSNTPAAQKDTTVSFIQNSEYFQRYICMPSTYSNSCEILPLQYLSRICQCTLLQVVQRIQGWEHILCCLKPFVGISAQLGKYEICKRYKLKKKHNILYCYTMHATQCSSCTKITMQISAILFNNSILFSHV